MIGLRGAQAASNVPGSNWRARLMRTNCGLVSRDVFRAMAGARPRGKPTPGLIKSTAAIVHRVPFPHRRIEGRILPPRSAAAPSVCCRIFTMAKHRKYSLADLHAAAFANTIRSPLTRMTICGKACQRSCKTSRHPSLMVSSKISSCRNRFERFPSVDCCRASANWRSWRSEGKARIGSNP